MNWVMSLRVFNQLNKFNIGQGRTRRTNCNDSWIKPWRFTPEITGIRHLSLSSLLVGDYRRSEFDLGVSISSPSIPNTFWFKEEENTNMLNPPNLN